MKHIKTFENQQEYEIDDYIVLKDHFVNKTYSLLGKVMKVYMNKFFVRRYSSSGKTDDWYSLYDIERKMTSDEIEEYNMNDLTNKYNL